MAQKKTDAELNKAVAEVLPKIVECIVAAYAPEEENHGVDDIYFSGVTMTGKLTANIAELKSLKGGHYFKNNGIWNDFYSTDNPNGITRFMMFGNTPPDDISIIELPKQWHPKSYIPEQAPMPDSWKGKHIYMLNAQDRNHSITNCKTYKVFKANACLFYVAPDGLILFTPKTLKEAFLGYAWFRNKSHTKEYTTKNDHPVWELKAFFDLDKGAYYPIKLDKELFEYKRY